MNKILLKKIVEKVDFTPEYEQIKSRINVFQYLNQSKKNNYRKYGQIMSLSLLFLIAVPIFILLYLGGIGQGPRPIPNIDEIENTNFGFVRITPVTIFQEANDVLVLNIEIVPWTTKRLRSLYIKGNSLSIDNAEAFATSLSTKDIDNEMYYYLDSELFDLENYRHFALFLYFEKNSCSKNNFYSDIVNSNIVAHSFNLYLNYDTNESQKENLRFYYEDNNIYGEKIICYNNIDDLLKNSYYQFLYLPDISKYLLSKELIYFPDDNILSLKSSNYYYLGTDIANVSYDLRVWLSETGILYGDQPKTQYSYNGINYMIISHEAAVTIEYSVDFTIRDEKADQTIQYSFLVKAASIDLVKQFIRDLSLYSV